MKLNYLCIENILIYFHFHPPPFRESESVAFFKRSEDQSFFTITIVKTQPTLHLTLSNRCGCKFYVFSKKNLFLRKKGRKIQENNFLFNLNLISNVLCFIFFHVKLKFVLFFSRGCFGAPNFLVLRIVLLFNERKERKQWHC